MEELIGAALMLGWMILQGIAWLFAQAFCGVLTALAGILHPTLNPRMRDLQRWALGFLGLALGSLLVALALGIYRSGWSTLVAYLVAGSSAIVAGLIGNAAEAEYKRANDRAPSSPKNPKTSSSP